MRAEYELIAAVSAAHPALGEKKEKENRNLGNWNRFLRELFAPRRFQSFIAYSKIDR